MPLHFPAYRFTDDVALILPTLIAGAATGIIYAILINEAFTIKIIHMQLSIETTRPGTGERTVKANDTISVQYTGKLENGTVFDSTSNHDGQPFTFTVGIGQVIQGWDQGLLGMKIGEKRTLTIPPELGYGSSGAAGVIPPNATLIFDVELVAIQ